MVEKSPHTLRENPTPPTDNRKRRGKLPLLGSNQDSPDPEARAGGGVNGQPA